MNLSKNLFRVAMLTIYLMDKEKALYFNKLMQELIIKDEGINIMFL